jgi:hypothetical protein
LAEHSSCSGDFAELEVRCCEFRSNRSPWPYEERVVSRAFVNEDAGSAGPRRDYHLPPRDDAAFDRAAARVLLEAARAGETASAEDATGYRWGEPRLRDAVQEILAEAEAQGDDRLEQLARRFLR